MRALTASYSVLCSMIIKEEARRATAPISFRDQKYSLKMKE